METHFKDKLIDLRKRIPIGMQHGILMLKQAQGDTNLAEKLFKEETIIDIINKTNVSKEVALVHLTKCNYDIFLTINSIDEERYSFTERILKKFNQDKFTALKRIAGEVERIENLQRDNDFFWFTIDHLDNIQPELFCLLLIMEWLNYEDYEGLDYAIYFHLDTVIYQISTQLLLPEISETLQNARKIYLDQLEEQKMRLALEGSLGSTIEFLEKEKKFENQKPLLFNSLFEFVKKHLDKFP